MRGVGARGATAPAGALRLLGVAGAGPPDVVARFGRQPHRNAVLGRTSTAEELAYLAAGELMHRRSFQG